MTRLVQLLDNYLITQPFIPSVSVLKYNILRALRIACLHEVFIPPKSLFAMHQQTPP